MMLKQSEKHVTGQLTKEVKRRGWLKYKQEGRGAPDWVIIPNDMPAFFIECKATGKRPRPEQLRAHEKLRALGHVVHVLDHCKDIDSILGEKDGLCMALISPIRLK